MRSLFDWIGSVFRGKSEAQRRYAELTRKNRELSLLSRGSIELFSAEGSDETVRRLSRLLAEIVPTKACAVVLWSQSSDEGGTVYRFGDCQPADQALLKWLVAAGYEHSAPRKPVLAAAGSGDRISSGPANQIIAGLQTVEVIYGIVIFESESPGLLDDQTIDVINLVLSQCSLALQDEYLKREMHEKNVLLERQAATMSTILDVSSGLLGTVDTQLIVRTVRDAIKRTPGVGNAAVALRDAKTGDFVIHATHAIEDGTEDDSVRIAASHLADLMIFPARVSHSYFYPLADLGRREAAVLFGREAAAEISEDADILIVPLTDQEMLAGIVALTMTSDERHPATERIRTIEIFANQAATALRSARQYEEIKRLSFTDALTPAYNHRYFQETLHREVRRHGRRGATFGLAMLDIDHFKSINDTHGHQVGDEILKGLVQLLIENVRDIDTVARYGGEEFAVILPDQDAEGALRFAERARSLLAEKTFRLQEPEIALSITVSIGVAMFPADAESPSTLIARADGALYHAKRTGRNRVGIAAEMPVGA